MLATTPLHDDDQASIVMQREVGVALRQSLKAMTHAPLPEQMAILLLRLALAESLERATPEVQLKGADGWS
jgi:hypothetical protein